MMIGCFEDKEPVQVIAIAPMVLVKSPLSWSQENNLALATQLGTYIFSLKSNCDANYSDLHYERTFLSHPDTCNPYITKGKQLGIVNALSKKEAFTMMLDDSLSATQRADNELTFPHMNKAVGGIEPNHVGYRKAIWSPVKLSSVNGSLLCLLTYDHQLRIAGEEVLKWKVICDLSGLWYRYLQEEDDAFMKAYLAKAGDSPYHQYLANSNLYIVSEVLWTNLFIDDANCSYSVLVVVTGSGHMVFWKFPSCSGENRCQPFVMGVSSVAVGKITSSFWFPLEGKRGYLLLGTHEGDVNIYYVSLENDKPTTKFIGNPEELQHGLTTNFVEMRHLPESDGMYLLCLGKHNIFMASLIHLTPLEVKVLSTAHCIVGSLAITGLNFVSDGLVYVSVKDRRISEVCLEVDRQARTVSVTGVEVVLSSAGVVYGGFAFSPNRAMWAVLESVSIPYDHLILRETSVINIFVVNKVETLCHHLLQNPSKSLDENLDIFQSIWLLGCKESSLALPFHEGDATQSLCPLLKRYWLWFSKFQAWLLEEEAKEQMESRRLFKSILRDWMKEHLSTGGLECNLKSPEGANDPLRLCSLRNTLTFLESEGFQEEDLGHLKELLHSCREEEKCVVCRRPLEFSHESFAVCAQGHKLPRCPRSLLTTKPLLQCQNCTLFYHPDAVQWYGSSGLRCLVCNKFLRHRVKKGPRTCAPRPNPAKQGSVKKRRRIVPLAS